MSILSAFLYLLPLLFTAAPADPRAHSRVCDDAEWIYEDARLDVHELDLTALRKGLSSAEQLAGSAHILAIADMTQPSTAKRLYVIDLERRTLLLRTHVAHGQGTGDLMAERFSNRHGSHQTSLGLYRVGERINSPKHGPALLLHGLEHGLNDQALGREVIIHGADYVSEDFIRQHGRLGRSWGCPAVSRTDMPRVIDLLANGGLLYVHGN